MPRNISNEQIYDKLLKIESILEKKLSRKSFTNIVDWKKYIWDNCPHKKEKVGDDEIDFWCEVLKAPCAMDDCPRNVIE